MYVVFVVTSTTAGRHHPPLVGSHTGAASADECSVIGPQATMETSIDASSVSSFPAAVLVELRIA